MWSYEALLGELSVPFGLELSETGTPEIWKNWRVRRVVVEDPANASFIDGKLKIAPCAGVLLFMAKDGVDWL